MPATRRPIKRQNGASKVSPIKRPSKQSTAVASASSAKFAAKSQQSSQKKKISAESLDIQLQTMVRQLNGVSKKEQKNQKAVQRKDRILKQQMTENALDEALQAFGGL